MVSTAGAQNNNNDNEQSESMEERRARYMRRMMNRFRLEGDVSRERQIAYTIEQFKDYVIYDGKTVWFDIEGAFSGDALTLTGEVIFPQHKSGIERIFGNLGYETIENKIKLLPDDTLPDTQKFALVTSYTARLVGDYNEPRSILDQALYGHYVRLLKLSENKDYYLAQIPNGYIGWLKSSMVNPISQNQWETVMNHFPKAMVMQDTQVATKNGSGLRLPRGCVLPVEEQEMSALEIALPGGGTCTIAPQHVRLIHPDMASGKDKILNITKELMGLDYKWGGFSPKGYDCSGFTRIVYQLRPGDLLFFCNSFGKIRHVGISLGGKKMLHSATPDIHINSLKAGDENYSERYGERLAFARRILPFGF